MTDIESDRAIVEQAKGAIMLRYGVSSYESLAALARWGREAHVPLPDVAHAMVKGICQGRVTADNQGLVRWLEQRLRVDIGEPPTAVGARQWRYTSAVHAARDLGTPVAVRVE